MVLKNLKKFYFTDLAFAFYFLVSFLGGLPAAVRFFSVSCLKMHLKLPGIMMVI